MASGFLRKHWVPVILWPTAIVTVFGLLQAFVLPQDFLKHFGYGPSTIPAYQTINSNQSYARIQSTLRGVNPYGAYLVLITSLIAALLLRMKRNWQKIILLIASLITLIYTFSRSAWIGTFVAVAFLVILGLYKTKLFSTVVISGVVVVLIVGALVVTNHSTQLQNIIYHTQTNSAVKTTSDQGHLSGLESGLKDIYHQPLGGGVGTAGPASTYNPKRIRIAENYYIQVGQETGIIGLGLFLAINICLGYRLWQRRSESLALGLFASFLGLVVVNMFSHAWADPTLGYLWWGLSGMAMTVEIPNKKKNTATA
jgi:O-antigen ligase